MPVGAAAELACFSSSEEIRMVRSIALLALMEAQRHGRWGASFHGFRVQAQRQGPARSFAAFTEVSLSVSLGKVLVERSTVTTNYADAMEPNAWAMVICFEYALLDSHAAWRASGNAVGVPRWLRQPDRCTLRIALRSRERQNR